MLAGCPPPVNRIAPCCKVRRSRRARRYSLRLAPTPDRRRRGIPVVNFGVFMFCTANTMQPAELAIAAEDLGFESLYFPEHTHIPMRRWNGEPPDRYGTVTLNREGIRPYGRPSDLDTFTFAEEYISLYDPFIAIATAAAVTDRLNFGTAISLINQHDTITFARELASLDRLSQGRLSIGFGGGWFPDEMADHGIPFEHRWQIAREKIEAMRELWTKKEPEYHGEFVDFDKCWMDMKPMRRGGPPFLLGTNSKPAHRRVVEYCDGWLAPPGTPAMLSEGIQRIRQIAEDRGRSMDTIDLNVLGPVTDERHAESLIEMGFDRLIMWLNIGTPTDVIPQLERYARIKDAFEGA